MRESFVFFTGLSYYETNNERLKTVARFRSNEVNTDARSTTRYLVNHPQGS